MRRLAGLLVVVSFLNFHVAAQSSAQSVNCKQPKEIFFTLKECAASYRQDSAPPRAASGNTNTISTAAVPTAPPEQTAAPIRQAGAPLQVHEFPLGLKYEIHKGSKTRPYEPVDRHTVFRTGDRLRLNIGLNDSAYLYVLSGGSSGEQNELLFPSAKFDNLDNYVVKSSRLVTVPSNGDWTLTDPPGIERLHILVAREPVADVESVISSFRRREPNPGVLPDKTLVVGNSVVDRFRQEMPRDIVFEQAEDTLVYVKEFSEQGRLYAEVVINHR